MADAQAKEHARQPAAAALLHLRHDLGCDDLAHEDVIAGHAHAAGGARRQCALVEPVVEVGHVGDEPGCHEIADELVAQPVDVHGLAAHPVAEALVGLRRAVNRDTAPGHLALLAHDGATAAGAGARHAELGGVSRTKLQHGTHDLGNHVASLVHHDRVAHAHVLAAHLVLVVQRGTRDGGPRHHHRVELGHRREHTRAAHLDADVAQDGVLLLGRELERDGPARRARREAQGLLAREVVGLHHHAVDVVVEAVAVGEGVGAVLVHLGGRIAAAPAGVHAKAAALEPLEEAVLRGHVERALVGHGVDEGLEVAVRRDLGVLLAKAARGGVARVGEGLAALGVGLLVQALEAVLGHIDLAADLERAPIAAAVHATQALGHEVHRHVADGAHVGADVLARGAVAARGRAHEGAVAVRERHAEAIDLELARVGDGVGLARAQGLVGASKPLVELVEVHRVVDRVHARCMRHRGELARDEAAHALGVGVGRHELGMQFLDGLELAEHPVELGVRYLGVVEGVVAVGVVVEQVAKLGRASSRVLGVRVGRAGGGGGALGVRRRCARLALGRAGDGVGAPLGHGIKQAWRRIV